MFNYILSMICTALGFKFYLDGEHKSLMMILFALAGIQLILFIVRIWKRKL